MHVGSARGSLLSGLQYSIHVNHAGAYVTEMEDRATVTTKPTESVDGYAQIR